MVRRRLAAIGVCTVLGVGALVGCGSDDTASPSDTTVGTLPTMLPDDDAHRDVTANPANDVGPGIDAFDAPGEVSCSSGRAAVVPVTWSAPAAQSVALLIDQVPTTTNAPNVGALDLQVTCDDAAHVITLVAVGDGEIPTVRSEAVRTVPGS